MKTRVGIIRWCWPILMLVIGGCQSTPPEEEDPFPPFPQVNAAPARSQELFVGTVAQVVKGQAIKIEGYGLVGGLDNTGSTTCPPNILAYLKRMSQTEVPDRSVNVEKLVRSRSSAVVRIEGTLAPLTCKNDPFDVKVTPLPGSDATSLRGGWLYNAQLWPVGSTSQAMHKIANAHGAVYVDQLDGGDPRLGYVLGGGLVLQSRTLGLRLQQPDYNTCSVARNVINVRFGPGTAVPQDNQTIHLQIPPAYQRQRERFLQVLAQTPLNVQMDYLRQRGEFLIQQLPVAQDRASIELALEAMGSAGQARLEPLLQSQDPLLRLMVARCLANLGSPLGLEQLRQLAVNPQNSEALRVAAIKALGATGSSLMAQRVLRPLWRDASLDVALTAYEQAVELGPQNVDRVLVGSYIQVDALDGSPHAAIVAHRSKTPRLVLVGGPLACEPGRTVVSPDQTLWLDTRLEAGWVQVARRVPGKSDLGPVRCPNNLKVIIQVLCADSHNTLDQPNGLGLSYADLLDFLKLLCEQGVIKADFWGGPLPESI